MDHRESDLRRLAALMRRSLWPALLVAVVVGAVTYYLSRTLPSVYEARATLVASAHDPAQRDFGITLVTAPTLGVATYQAAIRSRQVLADALWDLHGETPTSLEVDRLAGSVVLRVEDAGISSVIRVHVRHEDPRAARDLANAVAEAAVRWDQQRATRSLEVIVDTLEAQIAAVDAEIAAAEGAAEAAGLERSRAELQLQLSSARALRTAAVGRLELLEAADAPRGAVSPRPMRNAVLAGLLAAFLTYGLLLLRDALEARLRTTEDLARVGGVPVLAEFPRVAGRKGRRGLPVEAASYLRTALTFAAGDEHPKVFIVTSAGPGDGKSSVASALAESFARQHFSTLLVDADLREPVLGSEYGLHPVRSPSLHDALTFGEDAATVCRLASGIELHVIPSYGPVANPTELLANRMGALLERAKQDYDVIVIDSAPVLPVADTLTITPHATGVVFAVSLADADRRQVTNALGLLRRMGARVFGTVATNLQGASRTQGAGYGYGYGASQSPGAQPEPMPRTG